MMAKTSSKHIESLDFQKLSIQISLNGLSFCIMNVAKNEITSLQHFTFIEVSNPIQLEKKVSEILELQKEVLNQSFHEVTVTHTNDLSTFVPKPLFSDKNLSDYLKYNNKILANDYITFDVVANNDMVNVYIPYVNINNLLFDTYGAFQYKHFATVLVESIFHLPQKHDEPTVYVHTHGTQFELIIIQHKKLLLYNTFTFTSKEDYIYYLLFAIEQLQLNTNELPLYFLGDIDRENPLYKITYTYVRNVYFLEKQYTFTFDESVAHTSKDFVLLNTI